MSNTNQTSSDVNNLGGAAGQAPRHVLLNALPVNAFRSLGEVTVKIKYLGRLETVDKEYSFYGENYISHPATAALLGIPPSKNLYQAQRGDVGFIFTLASPVRGPGDKEVGPQDVDVYFFEVE
ncbi:MAG: hypothetical protein ACP5NY_04185 [Thermocladium sp.]